MPVDRFNYPLITPRIKLQAHEICQDCCC